MDPFILNDLLRRVASGRTTQADADFLQEAFGRLDGWLDPQKSRPDEPPGDHGRDILVVTRGTSNEEPPYVERAEYQGKGMAVLMDKHWATYWGHPCILLWRPWPRVPMRALAEIYRLRIGAPKPLGSEVKLGRSHDTLPDPPTEGSGQ